MAIIQWSPAMSVGVRQLDQDHQALIELINRIGLADDSETSRKRIIPEALTMLIAYTVFHFRREEAVMQACAYPEFDAHRDDHRALTDEVKQRADRYTIDPDSVYRDELREFLVQWLNHHILLHDKAYQPYCAGSPMAETAAERYGEFDIASLLTPKAEPGAVSLRIRGGEHWRVTPA